MNKNYTLKELAEIYMGSPMPESACTNTIMAGIQKVLDAIGYEFPKDEEREAFERWQKSMLLGFGGDQYSFEKATFEAWKAGREELRRDQMMEKEQDKFEFPPPPASGMKVCYWKDMPKDSNPYGKSMWAFGGWVGLYRDSNPAPDTIVAYLPEPKVKDESLTAEYKTEPAWIPWEGGECPLEDGVEFEFKTRCGGISGKCFRASWHKWRHGDLPEDIVAYRVLEG